MAHEIFPADISEPIRDSQRAFQFLNPSQFTSFDGMVILGEQLRLLLDQFSVDGPQPFTFQAVHGQILVLGFFLVKKSICHGIKALVKA